MSVLRAVDTTGWCPKRWSRRTPRGSRRHWSICTGTPATPGAQPVTGMKDLQRLPGLIAAAYQHETSRAGDPHLHTHVLVPNRQRAPTAPWWRSTAIRCGMRPGRRGDLSGDAAAAGVGAGRAGMGADRHAFGDSRDRRGGRRGVGGGVAALDPVASVGHPTSGGR